jgi:hypothetical protein
MVGVQRLTCELSGHPRHGARPTWWMINSTATWAWRHAVGAPLERGVRQRTPCHSTALPRVPPLLTGSRTPRVRLEVTADERPAAAQQADFQLTRLTCATAPWVLVQEFCLGLHVRLAGLQAFETLRLAQRIRQFVAVQFPPTGADFAGALHCFHALPNVRVKRATTVWRLARAVDDKQHCRAGQAPRRWGSA